MWKTITLHFKVGSRLFRQARPLPWCEIIHLNHTVSTVKCRIWSHGLICGAFLFFMYFYINDEYKFYWHFNMSLGNVHCDFRLSYMLPIKIILYKPCGEQSLLMKCKLCTLWQAQRCNFKKNKNKWSIHCID